ncbi:MAG: nucleotide exchange factor GrpE [Pseudomonadota bacterium]|nr:MAG: nucleotide exchange factor GrpE [Pseudomonadota bacterium]
MATDKHKTQEQAARAAAEEQEQDAAGSAGATADEPEASSETASESAQNGLEVARLREALLRTRAEMENVQKRSERELERARRFQLEALMRDLLPVIDGLEQGLENAAEGDSAREGLELTHRLLLKSLGSHGLEVIDPAGERFDPDWHEAMSLQPSDQAEPDTVLMVLQKGYRLHDRLLRAARVIVAKAPEAGEAGD